MNLRGLVLALALIGGTLPGAVAFALQAQAPAGDPVRELPAARASIHATGFDGTVLVRSLRPDPDDDGGQPRSRDPGSRDFPTELGAETFGAGHAERVDRRLIPASTFKIFNSLVAIETGVVAGPDTNLEWDGITRGRTELNRDLDLRTAFRISAVPHYQELARQIGPERMQEFIDAVGYGNRDISGGIDQFWLTGDLRISPREQVHFLTRLLRDELPFSPGTMAMVREMMETERTARHLVRSKTGWAVGPDDRNVGWWVGWVERGSDVHVFATVLEATTPDETFGPEREAVTRRVLEELGVLESEP